MRHMHVYGTRPEQAAMVKVAHSEHASSNPKALYRNGSRSRTCWRAAGS